MPPPSPGRRPLPLQWLLPLLTALIVVSVLGTELVLSSRMLNHAAVQQAQDRLTRGVHQLATVGNAAVKTIGARYAAVGRDGALRRALVVGKSAPVPDTVLKVLKPLTTPNDSGLPVELWSADGRRLAFLGNDVHDAIDVRQRSEIDSAGAPLAVHTGLAGISPSDSLHVSELYASGGRVYFWFVAPVSDSGKPLGFIAQQRRIAANPQTEQTLRELSGTSVTGYYRNVDGRFWATLGGEAVSIRQFANEQSIMAEEAVQGTPLVIVLQVDKSTVLAAPAALVRRLELLAALLTVVGTVLAWLLARRVVKPLTTLTTAAESLGDRDYAARVPVTGPAEMVRLAASFNSMATRIGESAAQLEQRETEFRALANAIPQLAWMAHADGSVFWYNQRWYEYTGTTLEQMQGWGWQLIHDPRRLPEVLSRWRDSIRTEERFEMEHTLRGADGEDRWFLTRVEPVRGRDGKLARWFGTNTDVQEIREARESARAASRAKSDFLATMSHELRTPLNAIGGYTELLEMELRGPVTAAQRRDLDRIRLSQQHLLGLISGVLDLSRIESGKVTYDILDVPVDPLLAGLDALVAPQAAAKQLVLEYAGAPHDLVALADREKLRQIMLNLLSNAIRYTPAGGHIVMSAAARDNTTVTLTVADNGPGIPLDRREAIFEPFVQLDRSLTQTREGVGLGLAISRDLARGMNGELRVEGGAGGGARFILILPRGDAARAISYAATDEMPIGGLAGL